MAVTGTQLDTRVRYLLQDETPVRWTQAETLVWINAGLNEIVAIKPNALVTTGNMICVAGTKQSIPSTAIMLIDVIRNMGVSGTVAGKAISIIDRQTLDQLDPSWHTITGVAVAVYFMYDPRNPRIFYVYPPQPSASPGYIEVAYSTIPTALSTLGSNIPLDDSYDTILIDYLAYRAYSKDSDNPSATNLAQTHYKAFVNALSTRLQLDFTMGPSNKQASPPKQGGQ